MSVVIIVWSLILSFLLLALALCFNCCFFELPFVSSFLASTFFRFSFRVLVLKFYSTIWTESEFNQCLFGFVVFNVLEIGLVNITQQSCLDDKHRSIAHTHTVIHTTTPTLSPPDFKAAVTRDPLQFSTNYPKGYRWPKHNVVETLSDLQSMSFDQLQLSTRRIHWQIPCFHKTHPIHTDTAVAERVNSEFWSNQKTTSFFNLFYSRFFQAWRAKNREKYSERIETSNFALDPSH